MRAITLGVIAACSLLAACQTGGGGGTALPGLGVDFAWTSADRGATRSPAFTVTNVPAGTATLEFEMVDLDVPTYNHGGGTVAYAGSPEIPAGAFSYRGPNPPSGSHRYRWTVEALDASGTTLARGTATQSFP